MIPFLDLNTIQDRYKTEINSAVDRVLNSGWYIGGEEVIAFESEFGNYLGIEHVISCGNATDGLELALRAGGIKQGDEVILPDFNWVSGMEAVLAVGATPVLVDVNHAGNITLETIQIGLSEKTRAIIGVHMFGLPFEAVEIKSFCNSRNIWLIEDAAHAHGAEINGMKFGTIGHMGVFSFYPTKLLGALGDGGAVVTHDSDLAQKLRLMTNHGQKERDQHVAWGKNSRLDAIQAAILGVKLKHLPKDHDDRKVIATKLFSGIKNAHVGLPDNQENRAWYIFNVLVPDQHHFRSYLKAHEIQTAIHYPHTLSQSDVYVSRIKGELIISRELVSKTVSIPFNLGLTDTDLNRIIETINGYELN